MHSETVMQTNSSNVIAISSHKGLRKRKLMECMLRDVPEDKRDAYGDSDVMRIILAFDHMDQGQAQQFYIMLSEQISTRSKKLMRECLKELLCWNSSLLPQIEEMAAGILMGDCNMQYVNI